MKRLNIIMSALLLAIPAPRVVHAAVGGGDAVVLKGGRQIFGEVVADSLDGVRISTNRGRMERTVPASRVETVHYADRPAVYRKGLALLRRGQYAEAAARFHESRTVEARPWLKVYAPFYEGESLALARRYSQAAAAYRQCLATDAKSRLAFDAQMGIGLCHYAAGQYEQAATEFDKLIANTPNDARCWLVEVSKANMLLVQGELDEARAIYQTLKNKLPRKSELTASVKLGLAIAAADMNAAGLDNALELPAANVLKCVAWKLRAGRDFKAKNYEDALNGYLRADFYLSREPPVGMFAKAAIDVPAAPGARGELLCSAGACAELLKKNDEAIALYESARIADPAGKWAKKARQRLEALQK